MRKFFGVLLIVFASIVALFILIAVLPQVIAEGVVFGLIIYLIPEALVIWLGVRLVKPKKAKSAGQEAEVKTGIQDGAVKNEFQNQKDISVDQAKALSLKEVKQLVAQKIDQVSDAGYTLSKGQTAVKFVEMNDPKMPFEFVCNENGKAELIANWKLANVDYLGLLGLSKHSLQKEFQVLMRFDEKKQELRCMDKSKTKSSGFSPLGGGMEFSTFSGKQSSVQKEIIFGRKKDGAIGKVADIQLDTKILHNAIDEIAQKCGWKVKRVAKL